MNIETFIVGMLSTNCYIVNCNQTKETIIIDPGLDTSSEADSIFNYIDQNKLKIKFIVNTHGHSDHLSGDAIMKEKYKAPICISKLDATCIENIEASPPKNVLLQEGSSVDFGHVSLKVMHTPGHTLGSICLIGNNCIFSGDTLFAGGIGRTDFPGGSMRDMAASLKKLQCLPENLIVYPGHGDFSVLGKEKRSNIFLQDL